MDLNKDNSILHRVQAGCNTCLIYTARPWLVLPAFCWMPPMPFYNFHRAVTYRLHTADTAHHLHLPAYIKDVSHNIIFPLCCWSSEPADPKLSSSPAAMLLLPSSSVSVLLRLRFHSALFHAIYRSACTVVLPIWAYIIAVGNQRDGHKWSCNLPIPPLFSCLPVIRH